MSRPRVTVHCLAAAVMSTRLLLSVGDGTSKNKCYLAVSTHGGRERNGDVARGTVTVIRGIMKGRTGREKAELCRAATI